MEKRQVKGVVVHLDPTSNELSISSAAALDLPHDVLELVRVEISELDELGPTEVDRRVAGTIIGALEVLNKRKIRK